MAEVTGWLITVASSSSTIELRRDLEKGGEDGNNGSQGRAGRPRNAGTVDRDLGRRGRGRGNNCLSRGSVGRRVGGRRGDGGRARRRDDDNNLDCDE